MRGQSLWCCWEQSLSKVLCTRQWDSHRFAQSPGKCHQSGKRMETTWSPSSTRQLNSCNLGAIQTHKALLCWVPMGGYGETAWAPLTLALKFLGRGGEQQLPFHVRGPSTAGNAWLLVARLDPAGEPAQVAAAVQGVGPDGSARGEEQNCTWCHTEGTGHNSHLTGLPHDCQTSAPPFLDPPEVLPTMGGLGHSPTMVSS